MCTFLDVEGAFNNTNHDRIVEAANKFNIEPLCSRWISGMLGQRVIITELYGISLEATATRGCPQGGVLSPLLWCLLIDALIRKLNGMGIYTLGYADDLTIMVRGKILPTISDLMQQTCNVVEDWCCQQGLSVNPSKTELVVFTKKRKLDGLVEPTLFGERLKRAKQVKHLGVFLDDKLTWNPHLDYVTNKARIALATCRRAIGQTWGLKPKTSLWMYTAIIRPIVTYASLVWWPKTKQKTAQERLERLQRLALLGVSGAMVTTPTAALEALLNIPPLHIFVERDARATAYRLGICGYPQARLSGCSEAFRDIPDGRRFRACPDGIPKRYDFEKPFNILIPKRSEWEDCKALPSQGLLWFTDGSKTATGQVGAGVFSRRPRVELSFNLGTMATVFQAEMFAIMAAADENLKQNTKGEDIFILSDSRAALGAIGNPVIHSRTVLECLESLKALGRHNNLTLMWVPGHQGITGNERADELAKTGGVEQFIGPEPALGLPLGGLRNALDRWTATRHAQHWQATAKLRQSKLFIKSPLGRKARELISLDRTSLRTLISLFTGHCTLRRHLHIMGVSQDSPRCRLCGEEDETPFHILCECVALARNRMLEWGVAFPQPNDYLELPARSVVLFMRDTNLLA